jgi:sulfur relay (sulfurtransferase) DsrC/TusE family protein
MSCIEISEKRLIQWLKQDLGQILIPNHWKINRFLYFYHTYIHIYQTRAIKRVSKKQLHILFDAHHGTLGT